MEISSTKYSKFLYATPLDVQLRTNVGGAVIKISKLKRAEATCYIGMIKISTTVGIVVRLDIYAYCHENHDSNDL